MSDLAALWAPPPESTDKSKSERPVDNLQTAFESVSQQVLDSWRSREDSYAFVPEKLATARKAEQKSDWEGALKAYQADLDEHNKGLSTWSDHFRNAPNSYDKPILADNIAMARCYEKLGKFAEAAKCQESSLKIYEKQYGYSKSIRCDYDQVAVDCLGGIAKNLEKTGKFAEAIVHHNALAEVCKKYGYSEYSPSDADRALAKYHDNVSRCLALSGKYDQAIEHQQKLRKIYEKQYGYSNYLETRYDDALLLNQKKLAALLAAKGDIPKALEVQEQIRQTYERKLGATDSYPGKHALKLAEHHTDVAALYKQQGKTQNSIEQRQAALKLYERENSYSYSYPRNTVLDGKILKVNSDLAADLLAAGRTEESLKHLEVCRRTMEYAEKPDRVALRTLKENMAQQYTKLGQHENALHIRKSTYEDYTDRQITGKSLNDAYKAMDQCYAKLGKDTKTELRLVDIRDFARRDDAEKAAYFLNKLPNKLGLSSENGALKIASDDFLKLANVLPGTDLPGFLRDQLKEAVPDDADVQKSVSAITNFLSGLKSISVNGKDKRIEIVTCKEHTISLKFHAAFEGIIVGPQFNCEIAASQGEVTKIELNHINGLKTSSLSGMLKTEVQSFAVKDEKQPDGTLNRVIEVGAKSKEGRQPSPVRFTIMQNVPKESADALRTAAGKIDAIAAKIGAGDINSVLEQLGAGKLDGTLAKIAADFSSFSKDSSSYTMQFKNPQSLDIAQFGSPVPGTITLAPTVKFYRHNDKYSLDLAYIDGVNANLGGDVTRINGGNALSTNIQDLYLGGMVNNSRMLHVKADNVIKSIYLDVDSNFNPVPNSKGRVRMINPLVGNKMESIDFKFDGNGNASVSKGDIAYLIVEGGRSRVYDAMEWLLGK